MILAEIERFDVDLFRDGTQSEKWFKTFDKQFKWMKMGVCVLCTI